MTCFVFSTDEEAARLIRQALGDLGVAGEFCSEGFAAVERLSQQAFQMVIVDWDDQPEAGSLLTTARQRKASERPLTLAIVKEDTSVPKALQAGANSILRKPIVAGHCKDTLATACDLLKARQASAKSALTIGPKAEAKSESGSFAIDASIPTPPTIPASMEPGKEKGWRAGEFLQSAPVAPGAQFETESETLHAADSPAGEPVDPLKELEPVASAVQKRAPAEPEETLQEKPHGLDWYLKTRGGNRGAGQPAAPAQANPDVLRFEHSSSDSSFAASHSATAGLHSAGEEQGTSKSFTQARAAVAQPKKEEDETSQAESEKPRRQEGRRARVRPAFAVAVVLAGVAVALAPQAPWHPKVLGLWNRGQKAVHAWLNPQLVTPTQAPVSHENFARAGDEYKLPVAENIPDATTDPSQIKVVPVVDPTAKKANNDNGGEQAATATNGTEASSGGTEQTSVAESQPTLPTTEAGSDPAAGNSADSGAAHHSDSSPTIVPSKPPVLPKPAPQRNPQVQYVSTPVKVPSSLQSQMASTTPAAGGDKPAEAAMPSIEPVSVPEAAERALLTEQPNFDYPANGGGQAGSVMVQILVGRDGAVEDAKFLQGSLAFAKAAVDGVKQWKFKPYVMNGRPVSVQTVLTIKFSPAK
jgi:TonB family protein